MSTLTATTSSTNPSLGAGDVGKSYFETDTNKILVWDGSNFMKYETDSAIGGAFNNEYAVRFDGASDYFQSSSSQSYTLGTLSLWFKLDNAEASDHNPPQALMGFNGSYFGLVIGGDTGLVSNELIMFRSPTGHDYAYTISGGSMNTDWHFLAVTWNSSSSEYEIYIDQSGTMTQVQNTKTGTGHTQATVNDVMIGHRDINTGYLDGLIDEVAIFSQSMTQSQIQALYNSGVPSDLSSLNPTSWWRMDSGSSVTDQNTTTGNNLSVGGGAPSLHDLSLAPDSIYIP
jgi:hypothetical protein